MRRLARTVVEETRPRIGGGSGKSSNMSSLGGVLSLALDASMGVPLEHHTVSEVNKCLEKRSHTHVLVRVRVAVAETGFFLRRVIRGLTCEGCVTIMNSFVSISRGDLIRRPRWLQQG